MLIWLSPQRIFKSDYSQVFVTMALNKTKNILDGLLLVALNLVTTVSQFGCKLLDNLTNVIVFLYFIKMQLVVC